MTLFAKAKVGLWLIVLLLGAGLAYRFETTSGILVIAGAAIGLFALSVFHSLTK